MDKIVTFVRERGIYPPLVSRLFGEQTSEKTKQKIAFLTFVILPLGLGIEVLYLFAAVAGVVTLYKPADLKLALAMTEDKSRILELLRESGRAQEALTVCGADIHEKILALRSLAKQKARTERTEAIRLLEQAYALVDNSPFIGIRTTTSSSITKTTQMTNSDKSYDRTMELAETINDLASLLQDQPEKDSARIVSLFERAIHVGKDTVGSRDPRVTLWLVNLAILKQELGQFGESMQLFEEVLDNRKAVLGNDDPMVARWMVEMAYLLLSRPDAVEIGARIEELVHGALQIRKRIYGNDHVDVAASLNDCALMAALTAKDGDDAGLARARQFGQQSVETYVRVLGKDHPTTQKARADWGC
jgi:tetratricopeptide (TPR) repeat protein